MKFPLYGHQVIQYQLARELLYRAGFRMVRHQDDLTVYPLARHGLPGYFQEAANQALPSGKQVKPVGRLMIDEGFFSDCLVGRGSSFAGVDHLDIQLTNFKWDELVDSVKFLQIFVKQFIKGFEPEPTPYIGRGRSQRHYHEQYANALLEMKTLELPRLTLEWVERL